MYFIFPDDDRVSPLPSSASGQRHATRGFSLLEVMVVVAILGVLAALAGPSFGPLIERWRVRQATEDLQSTLHYARSEAIKRGGNISIKAKTGKDWGSGWQVIFDNSGTNEVLQNTDAPAGVSVTLTTTGEEPITVDRWGKAGETAFTFGLKPTGAKTGNTNGDKLCVGIGGRIKRGSTCP